MISNSANRPDPLVLVTGANGYVGVHLVERLCAGGMPVRALVRSGCDGNERASLAAMGAEVIEADIEMTAELTRALEGVETVVHLIGSIERPRRGGYEGMHVEKTKRLMNAFKTALPASRKTSPGSSPRRPGRVIYLSTVGAGEAAGNRYGRTKWEAEEVITRSGCEYVIVRSSLIFGRETGSRDSKLVRKLAHLAATRSALPLIGGGRNRLQPVYIGDLISCVCAAIALPSPAASVWEIGGPFPMSLRDIARSLTALLGMQRRIVSIPYPVGYLLGLLARVARAEGTINLEQVRLSRRDNLCARNMAAELTGAPLVGFEEGMRRTTARFGVAAIAGGTDR
ncbi:MAG: NAD-dependent epimerase/dehydratase family protein [Candidatus Aureabacteria bacterium]|nr:NAD-dependent epimerase/dehydratase family protein [Candidatus Auribacterota bacterium]